jgi:hypothetical protein
VQSIADAITPKTKTPKANTSKPRTTATKPKAATGAGVVKAKKPRTKTEKVVDTIVGKSEKVIGDVEGKPGKKVRYIPLQISRVFGVMSASRDVKAM